MTAPKRIALTLVTILGCAGTIVGLLLDAPDLIQRHAADAPTWLRNPDVWWVVVCATVTGVVLWAIWRNAEPTSRPMPRCDFMEGDLYRAWFARRLDQILTLPHAETGQAVLHLFEHEVPVALRAHFGKRESSAYLAALDEWKESHGAPSPSPDATVNFAYYAHAYLLGADNKRTYKVLDAEREELKRLELTRLQRLMEPDPVRE